MIEPGNYRARATAAELGFTSKGSEQIAVSFELLDHPGQFVTWYGGFSTEKKGDAKMTPCERTFESLRFCGWDKDDLTNLDGIDTNEVSLTIANEEDLEGKLRTRVKWVNRPGGGGPSMKNIMPANQRAGFAAKMKAAAIASRSKLPPKDAKPANSRREPPPGSGDAYEDPSWMDGDA